MIFEENLRRRLLGGVGSWELGVGSLGRDGDKLDGDEGSWVAVWSGWLGVEVPSGN